MGEMTAPQLWKEGQTEEGHRVVSHQLLVVRVDEEDALSSGAGRGNSGHLRVSGHCCKQRVGQHVCEQHARSSGGAHGGLRRGRGSQARMGEWGMHPTAEQ